VSSVTACLSDMPHLSQVKLGTKVAQAQELGGVGVMDQIASVVPAGLSLKFWRVAAGETETYPRSGSTMELGGGWRRRPSS
jgi:hypothetical protein